jgi:MFS-type transporter involved in bile tolerance (Atg22 family)
MEALSQILEMDQETAVVLVLAALIGSVLGGAIAHWRRGKEMIVTGAIIGAIMLPVIAVLASIYFTVGIAVIAAFVILGMIGSFLG